MRPVEQPGDLRELVGDWRRDGGSLGFVPTMGNLHQGHLDLVERARSLADRVVVSIFVNPTQFGENEDLSTYPRTPEEDRRALSALGVDCLFTPAAAQMYPLGLPARCLVQLPGISDVLCGASRPGHFTGVATVVAKLLNLVAPDVAVFGEKDFQQLIVIRRMVAELFLPVRIEGVPTRREPDGLAMSSRNRYLDAGERERAPALYRTLAALRDAVGGGRRDYAALEREGAGRLERAGFRVDYLAVRRAADLAPPEAGDSQLVILGAAWMGPARLIDNVRVCAAPTAQD
ncbi:MAG TPA: pantoate--beta-alanine ligase [Gammaproteobacteria bacterium]|nr:pantoate--beta-alanine ligase [Gammaproteobacteria bacterium]